MAPTVMDTRREQMFPALAPAEVDRLRHFGQIRTFEAGDGLVRVGERGHGLTVILNGQIAVTRRDGAGPQVHRDRGRRQGKRREEIVPPPTKGYGECRKSSRSSPLSVWLIPHRGGNR